MTVYSHDDLLMYRVFPSSLKGVALDCFYTLPSWSLRSFEEVSDAFFNQYASRQEFKKNSNHLLTVKMKHGETFKRYISNFQSQIALVCNCNNDIVAAAFTARLQTNHSFYKHLVKHDVANLKDIMSRA